MGHQRLRELGGRIAHHAVWPDVDLDHRFEPVVAWHNPDAEYLTRPIEGATNVMSAPWYDPPHFRSDSNQHWRFRGREGRCPHGELARGSLEWLHLLDPSRDLGVRRGDDEGDDGIVPRRRQGTRHEQLRADRIDLT